jgi:hypothetical protein
LGVMASAASLTSLASDSAWTFLLEAIQSKSLRPCSRSGPP